MRILSQGLSLFVACDIPPTCTPCPRVPVDPCPQPRPTHAKHEAHPKPTCASATLSASGLEHHGLLDVRASLLSPLIAISINDVEASCTLLGDSSKGSRWEVEQEASPIGGLKSGAMSRVSGADRGFRCVGFRADPAALGQICSESLEAPSSTDETHAIARIGALRLSSGEVPRPCFGLHDRRTQLRFS